MTFTFTGNLDTPLDRIRDIIGDTDSTNPLRTDERINAAYANVGNSEPSTIGYVSQSLVAEFSQQPIKVAASGISVDYTPRLAYWQMLAQRYGTAVHTSFSYLGARNDGYAQFAAQQNDIPAQ